MTLIERYKAHLQKENLLQPGDRLLLAVSGGLDSVVLCELCRQGGYDFEIAHCNFHLRGNESDRDMEFVEKLGVRYQVKTLVKHFDTKSIAAIQKTSIEETARNLRYQWFHELLDNAASSLNYILTAHHADDNVETVLMNFFRGTGINGLKGIPARQGKLVRPLLFARRSELEIFATENQLEYVTDSSNLSNDYTRNYFRNELLPAISNVYPEAKENVLRNIHRFKESALLYREAVEARLKKLKEYKGNEVHVPVLKLQKVVPLSTIVYELIKDFGFTAQQTEEVIALLSAGTGKYVSSATHRVIKNRNWLIIAPLATTQAEHLLIETTKGKLSFSAGTIEWEEKATTANDAIPAGAHTASFDAGTIQLPLLLRKWKTSDYFYPLGMQKKKKLGRFLSDQKLSLTQKENLWVLEMDKKIAWVVGMRIDDRFKIKDKTTRVLQFRFLVS